MIDFTKTPDINYKRSFEHGVTTKSKLAKQGKFTVEDDSGVARKYFYKTLMNITIKHSYYNGQDDKCPDFSLMPTYASAGLMRTLGLLLKKTSTGISILYNVKNKSNLLRYLKSREVEKSEGVENWCRLSFVAILNNPLFINFTDLSFETNSSVKNFYLSNQQAHLGGRENEVILNEGEFINQSTQDSFEVVPVQYEVEFGDATRIEVCDISGESVMCLPKSIPVKLAKIERIELLDCCKVDKYLKKHQDSEIFERKKVYIDFSKLIEGCYKLKWILANENSYQKNIIYTHSSPSPLCFIDLMFSQPEKYSEGIYPVSLKNNSSEGDIVPVEYQIRFNQRATYWVYWIVKQSMFSDNIKIISDKGVENVFYGPYEGKLITGEVAFWFVSKEPLSLEQIPSSRFKLIEQPDEFSSRELINPLPVASNRQVVTKNFLKDGGLKLNLLNPKLLQRNLINKETLKIKTYLEKEIMPMFSEIYVYV